MRNYRIAYFTADWNYELVESTLHGLKQYVDDHENVSLRIFDCFGKDTDNAKNRSEFAIFDLADMSRFDGVIIQGNQIIHREVREKLTRRVLEAGIPAVTIDCQVPGCTLIGVDNQQAQYEIVKHVIQVHGARRLVYLTGILDNGSPEGRQRMNGFLQACDEAGVSREDVQVIPCTWRTGDGSDVARRWTRERLPLPDAFVCANDEMALGLVEGLQEGGVRVPEDVIVTGFDNLTSAELSSPRLSSVSRDYRRLNYMAMGLLIDKIDGRESRESVPFDFEVVCSESCGCSEAQRPDYIRHKYFQQIRFLRNFYILQDQMAEELFEASDLPDLMRIVEKNQRIFGCDNAYLCVNDYYYENYDKKQWTHSGPFFGEEMILAASGHRDNSRDGAYRDERFPTREILPHDLAEEERFLVIYPLHYNTYSIGYLALDGISQAAKLNLHESIFSFLEIAIENVRKKGLLRQLNETLDDLYVHDALTGLYNRFGLARFGQQIYEAFLAEDGGAQILFIDMDDMKGINDRYGHEMGDEAILATARVLKDVCGPRDFLMRYGGDEFMVIASSQDSGLEQAIQQAVERDNRESATPFTLRLSIGVMREDGVNGRTLEECVKTADTRMYEKKKRRGKN